MKEKILAEIERRVKENTAKQSLPQFFGMLQEDLRLLDFVNSLPEEPVSEDLEAEIKDYDKSVNPQGDLETLHNVARYFAQWGARWQREQMMANAFTFTKEHDTACILASECLRNHGWFNRERDFNGLWRHLSCVDELFEGKFSGKTKVIVVKED